MRKIAIFVLAVMLLLTVTGCNLNRRIGEKAAGKAAERAAENILGKLLGSEANIEIDLDEEKFVIKDNEGGSFSIGSGEWPDVDYIPRLEGKIISTQSDSSGNVMIALEGVKESHLADYLQKVKKDFSQDFSEMQQAEYYAYGGTDAAGHSISVQIYKENSAVVIIGRAN